MLEQEVLNAMEENGATDIEMNKILKRAFNTQIWLKAGGRIEKIGKFVADHFTKYIEPMNYKAFLVAVDREACALYRKS